MLNGNVGIKTGELTKSICVFGSTKFIVGGTIPFLLHVAL